MSTIAGLRGLPPILVVEEPLLYGEPGVVLYVRLKKINAEEYASCLAAARPPWQAKLGQ